MADTDKTFNGRKEYQCVARGCDGCVVCNAGEREKLIQWAARNGKLEGLPEEWLDNGN